METPAITKGETSPLEDVIEGIGLLQSLDQTAPVIFRTIKPKAAEALQRAVDKLRGVHATQMSSAEAVALQAVEKLGIATLALEAVVANDEERKQRVKDMNLDPAHGGDSQSCTIAREALKLIKS